MRHANYECTDPLEVTFAVAGGHYSGVVTGGNLFLQPDISDAPIVRWQKAAAEKLTRPEFTKVEIWRGLECLP